MFAWWRRMARWFKAWVARRMKARTEPPDNVYPLF